jgi:hypothetical protein
VAPANQKWYRNYYLCRTIVETLRTMNPQYPPALKEMADVELD